MPRTNLLGACLLAAMTTVSFHAMSAEDGIGAGEMTIEKEVPRAAPERQQGLVLSPTATTATQLPYGATFAGVVAGGNSTMSLRITNRGPRAGTATVTLVNAATGAVLSTWTSGAIPLFGAIQTSIAAIAAASTPTLTAAQIATPMNLRVSTTFAPATQLIAVNSPSGTLTNLSACGGFLFEHQNLLGYVEGPGTVGATGAVRIVNTGASRTSHTQLTLYNAATGASLGTWTTPDVPPNGSVTVSTATIAAAATPVIPATTAAMTVLAVPVRGLRLEHVVMAGGALTDMTSACSP